MSTSGMPAEDAGWGEWEAVFRSATAYSLVGVMVTVIVAALHLGSHLKNYSRPRLQRHVVRIIFMTPIYACCSYLTLQTGHRWPNVLRDIYEAWVIYCFLAILFETLGGEAAIANHVKDGGCPPLPQSWFWGTCCLDPLWSSRISFLKFCRAGTLQFALLKPLCAAAQLLLQGADMYAEGEYLRFDRGFVYIALVYNVSISLSIYALVLFYIAMRDKLAPFQPVLKYIAVKSVIFLSYWQGFLLQLVAPTVRAAEDAQNFLITIEMAIAAVGMAVAFPVSQFQARAPTMSDGLPEAGDERPDAEKGSASLRDKPEQAVRSFNEMAQNLGQAVNLRDVADETRTIFGTGYRDHAQLGEDEADDFERESFSELANAKGRGGLTPETTRRADAGAFSALSLGKRKAPMSMATREAPVAKPVDVSRESGWEASFDGASDSNRAEVKTPALEAEDVAQVNADARSARPATNADARAEVPAVDVTDHPAGGARP